MIEKINTIADEISQFFTDNAEELEQFRIKFLGSKGLIKQLFEEFKALPKEENKSKSFAKIITSIVILTSSLDFEKGEPIASNLFNLYDYCRREVLDSYKNLKTTGIDKSINIVEDILSAWREIG